MRTMPQVLATAVNRAVFERRVLLHSFPHNGANSNALERRCTSASPRVSASLAFTMCLLASVTAAQERRPGSPAWLSEVSIGGAFDVGTGGARAGLGTSISYSILRTGEALWDAPSRCLGATLTVAQTWSGVLSGHDVRVEQWLLGGPRIDAHDPHEEAFVLLQPFIGVKRVLAVGQPVGEPENASSHLAFGTQAALAVGVARNRDVRFGISYAVTPGDSASRHHLTLQFGLDFTFAH